MAEIAEIPPLPAGFILQTPDVTPQATPQDTPPLPEGFVLQASTDAGIPITEAPIEEPGIFEQFGTGVAEDFESRVQDFDELNQAVLAGDITQEEAALGLVGKVGAGFAMDLIGEALLLGGRGIAAITPQEIADPISQTASKVAHSFLNTDLGKAGMDAAQSGFEAYNEFAAENPRAARNIESVMNIGLLLAPIKGKPKISAAPTAASKKAPTILGRAAEGFTQRAEAQTARSQVEFLDDLVRPKQTAAVRSEQIRRTTEGGAFSGRTVQPSAAESAMADAVGSVQGVTSNNTMLNNLNLIDKEVRIEADALKKALSKNDIIVPRAEFTGALDDAIVRLGENPTLVGDAARSASRVMDKMKSIVAKNKSTGSGLLQSRKELDAWIKTQKPKIFDPAQESALSTAVREIRQTTNDFIDQRVVNVGVKQSLARQSNLLRSVENIAPKAAEEASNGALRLFQNIAKAIPIKGDAAQKIVTGLGIGGLGVAATMVPFMTKIAIGGGTLVIGGKIVASPATKKGVSTLLRLADEAIKKTKDPRLLLELRADRAALAEGFKQINSEDRRN